MTFAVFHEGVFKSHPISVFPFGCLVITFPVILPRQLAVTPPNFWYLANGLICVMWLCLRSPEQCGFKSHEVPSFSGGWRFARLAVCADRGRCSWRFARLAVGGVRLAVGGLGGWRFGRLAVWAVGGLGGWRFGRLAVWAVGGLGGWLLAVWRFEFGGLRLAVCVWRFAFGSFCLVVCLCRFAFGGLRVPVCDLILYLIDILSISDRYFIDILSISYRYIIDILSIFFIDILRILSIPYIDMLSIPYRHFIDTLHRYLTYTLSISYRYYILLFVPYPIHAFLLLYQYR